MKRLGVLLFLFIVLNASCADSSPSLNCSELILSDVQSLFSDQITIEDITARLLEIYHLSQEDVSIDKAQGILAWQRAGTYYTVYVSEKGVNGIHVEYNKHPPTADSIIRCVGEPDRYLALFGADVEAYTSSLDLIFSNKGVWAHGYIFSRRFPEEVPKMSGEFPIRVLNIVEPPQSLEDVFGSLTMMPFKHWPGNWQQTEFEIDTNTLLDKDYWGTDP